MDATIFPLMLQFVKLNFSSEFKIGVVIALMIMGYLLYTLINPEEF
jgi:K+-transporting ATPase KdpF subunit